MPVSEKGQFIFIHIPKFAGTSIEHALKRRYSLIYMDTFGKPKNSYPPNFVDTILHGTERHYSAYEIMKILGATVYKSYFSFAIVRHPINRLLSFFKFANEKENKGIDSWKTQVRLSHSANSFEDFVEAMADRPQVNYYRLKAGSLKGRIPFD